MLASPSHLLEFEPPMAALDCIDSLRRSLDRDTTALADISELISKAVTQRDEMVAGLLAEAEAEQQNYKDSALAAAECTRLRMELEAAHAQREALELAFHGSGAHLTVVKLEDEARQAAERRREAEERALAAEERAIAAERAATAALEARAENERLREQLAAERLARAKAEQVADSLSEKLAVSTDTCRGAAEECSRVRRRNQTLERELRAVKLSEGESI